MRTGADVTRWRLDDVTVVVRAPNPSPMTLDGTNTYLLGAPGSAAVVVVDPGPNLPAHRRELDDAVGAREVVAVVVTHAHADHAEAAAWGGDWGAQVHAFTPALLDVPAVPLRDGDVLRRAGVALKVLATPGHAADHICLRVDATGALLSGDHVLGRGTTMVGWPDGSMTDYLDSLQRLLALGPTVLYPGHGPVVADPAGVVAAHRRHRLDREAEVIAALAAGDRTAAEIVARVYAAVDPALHPAAQRTVRAHLEKLCAEERVRRRAGAPGEAAAFFVG